MKYPPGAPPETARSLGESLRGSVAARRISRAIFTLYRWFMLFSWHNFFLQEVRLPRHRAPAAREVQFLTLSFIFPGKPMVGVIGFT